ncbi:MAG TPA: Wzz/FepE/Etk N-terminal domain-containing protein, partial [Chitinophagaceae bacterium]|nr:Wzz/FepE/Etk N-terminal domain-containing protein [Chitinophagaceae bacterium]
MGYPVADNDINELPVSPGGNQFDVKRFIFKLVGFLPWIIISVLIGYSIATLYLRYTPQVHKVSAQLLIKDDQASSPDYNIIRDLGVMPGAKEIQDQIDILESYALVKNVVDSLHLQLQIFAKGRVATSALYGALNPVFINLLPDDSSDFKPQSYRLIVRRDKFLLQAPGDPAIYHNYGDTILLDGHRAYLRLNTAVKPNANEYTLVIRDTKSVARSIISSLDIRQLHDMGGILAIAITDEIVQKAVDIVDVLIKSFIDASKIDKSIVAKKTNQFLRDRVEDVEKNLNGLEITADSFKSKNNITDISVAGNQYLSEVITSDKEKANQEGQIKLLNSLNNFISNAKSVYD